MDITAKLRKMAIQNAINEARILVRETQWKDRVDTEIVEFPDGTKPRPLV
jgi:hypothetical protein